MDVLKDEMVKIVLFLINIYKCEGLNFVLIH